MATLTTLIASVRRRAADVSAPQTYANDVYYDALEFALGKLNLDWGLTYTLPAYSDPLLPDTVDVGNYQFLLIKLATIEMAYIRAGETPTGESESYQTITVPDLNVQFMGKAPSDVWLSLAQKLQNEYDGELASGSSGTAGAIATASFTRRSTRTGGVQPYQLSTLLTAVTPTTSVSGSTVTISWTEVKSVYFSSYEIYRDTLADMSTRAKITTIADNHTESYDDENLSADTYYYQVVLVDMDARESTSTTVSAVVS